MNNTHRRRPLSPHQGGFTLVELMIVVVIVAILAAVAYPSYQTYAQKTRRATAAACLTELSQWMERNHTTCLAYNLTGAACGTALTTAELPALQCRNDVANAYTIAFAANPTATAYTLNAAPRGPQASDTRCGTLTLNQAGTKGAAAASGCWN